MAAMAAGIFYMIYDSLDLVDVGGVKFNIPQGFKQIENSNRSYQDANFTVQNISHTNGNELFLISVADSKEPADDHFFELFSQEKKNYNGVDGYLIRGIVFHFQGMTITKSYMLRRMMRNSEPYFTGWW